MTEIRKRPETEGSGEVVGKRPRILPLPPGEDENEEELLLAEFSVDEETLMEVMKVLEKEISCPANANNGNTNSNLSSSAIYSQSSSFVTINGNEESCGPCFSDSSSTVMASVDMGGSGTNISYAMGTVAPVNGIPPMNLAETTEEEQGWPEIGENSVSPISGEGTNNGCDYEVEESDDEWLARVLSGAPFEFEV